MWKFLHRLLGIFRSLRSDLQFAVSKYLVERQVINVLKLTHAQELMSYPRNEWPLVRSKQAEEIRAVAAGKPFDIVDRRSWAFPYLPEALHRLNQPILKNSPYNLRRFSETPIPRRAINLIKNAILSLRWQVQPTSGEDDLNPEREQKIQIAEECLKRPNNTESFREWLEACIEDYLLNGAGVIEPRMTPYFQRPFKAWAVDSSTIRIFMDWTEGTPDRPRYAQMTGLKGERGIVTFLDSELIYIRDNCRTCYSDDTETLTKRGWVAWPEVRDWDVLATRNPRTGKFEWQRPSRLTKAIYNGKMVGFKGQSVDLLVTPNHRMMGYYPAESDRIVFNRADEVAKLGRHRQFGYQFRVPVDCKWVGTLPSTGKRVRLESQYTHGYPGHNKTYDVDLKDWVAFLGLYVAEGSCAGSMNAVNISAHSAKPHYVQAMAAAADEDTVFIPKSYEVVISQVKASRHYGSIRKLLFRLPFDFAEGPNGFRVKDKTLHSILSPLGNKYTKYVPEWVKDLPPDYLKIFVDWAVVGDGWKIKIPTTLWRYCTVSKRLADDIQEIAQKLGLATTIYTHKPRARKTRLVGRVIGGDRFAPAYTVLQWARDFVGLGAKKAYKADYHGYVYCASVPNETLCVRRNGVPIWCGNSTPFGLGKTEVAFLTINNFLGAQDMAGRAGADQVHKTWLWWSTTLQPGHMQTIRRHITNEIEGQAKVSLMAGVQKPDIVEVTPVTPDDLLIEWQKFMIDIIANAFDLSPMALGQTEHTNRAIGQVMADSDFRSSVVPTARRFEEAITRHLIHGFLGWKDLEFKFIDLDDPDALTKTIIQQRNYMMNAITPDEIRKKMGLPPIAGGWGKLTMSQLQILTAAELAKLTGKAAMPGGSGGFSGGGGSSMPMGGGSGMGMGSSGMGGSMMSATDVAGMDPETIQLFQEYGILPPTQQLGQQMEQQQPGILETLTDELQTFFKYVEQVDEQDEIQEQPITPADERSQLQKFAESEHQESLAEKSISRRGVFGPAINQQFRKAPERGRYPRSGGTYLEPNNIQDRTTPVVPKGKGRSKKVKKTYRPGRENPYK
jgi:hypothetical protein